jgi:hypothetical protein
MATPCCDSARRWYGETEMEALQEAYKQFDVKTEAERRRIYLRSQ